MSTDFIPTRGSMKKTEEINFDAVVYQSHKPKKKLEVKDSVHVMPTLEPTNEINMKRARFEIMKFGMSGFNNQKKEEAKVQLAIKLGAKPPKNKYKNYKDLLKERRKEKNREKKKKQIQQLSKTRLIRTPTNKKKNDKNRKKEKGLLDIYGKVKGAIAK